MSNPITIQQSLFIPTRTKMEWQSLLTAILLDASVSAQFSHPDELSSVVSQLIRPLLSLVTTEALQAIELDLGQLKYRIELLYELESRMEEFVATDVLDGSDLKPERVVIRVFLADTRFVPFLNLQDFQVAPTVHVSVEFEQASTS